MRIRLTAFLLIAGALTMTLSLIRGQESPTKGPPKPELPPSLTTPAVTPTTPTTTTPAPSIVSQSRTADTTVTLRPVRDLSQLSKLQQQVLLTAQRGADWLFRMNGFKGRFLPGYNPALKQVLEGDNWFQQVGAARALARAARFCGEERYAVRATQAVLSLLEETTADPRDARCRYTSMPPALANRLGASAALILAINELPSPQKDLLDRSEELCQYLARQAQKDGSFLCEGDTTVSTDEYIVQYHAAALHACMLSHRHRPAKWKLDLLRKALPHYRVAWNKQKSQIVAPALMAAFAEAFLTTKEKAFGEFVCEMADWMCELQYTQIHPSRMLWYGGFKQYKEGQAIESAPDTGSGLHGEALTEACRVTREMGDLNRFQKYSEAVERCTQFLATLQYTDAITQHYQPWFRPQILGAFHASHQDGNLRIAYTQHAVSMLFGYLEHVVR